MAKTNGDKIVGNIYETYEYDKFTVLPENRGQKEKKGLHEGKLKNLQHKINTGTWIHSMSRVKVNSEFHIVDGAHTLEICRRNELPVRYELTTDEHFNDVSKREMIGNIFNLNGINTSWTSAQLFKAAVQVKAPLALLMDVIIEDNDNYFTWLDLLALLKKEPLYFHGRWRDYVTMETFEDKELVEQIKTDEFDLEVKSFVKINNKARISHRRTTILSAAYTILWNAHDMIKPLMFRKSVASLPDNLVLSERNKSDDLCRRMLLQHYNKSQGQNVETSAVLFALKHKTAEPVLEI